jgi:hypothetical protein
MGTHGFLTLRDREFSVSSADIRLYEDLDSCSIEITAEPISFDGEWWGPRLYHQGINLHPARKPADLPGNIFSWQSNHDANYAHPEPGLIYVFGHHDVYDCELSFGEVKDGLIELRWSGLCDVFWDEPFMEKVPFFCQCRAAVHRS